MKKYIYYNRSELEVNSRFPVFLQTLGELNWGKSELKPRTKLACWFSPLCGFHAIDADKQDGRPNLETESVTFWNSACQEWTMLFVQCKGKKRVPRQVNDKQKSIVKSCRTCCSYNIFCLFSFFTISPYTLMLRGWEVI